MNTYSTPETEWFPQLNGTAPVQRDTWAFDITNEGVFWLKRDGHGNTERVKLSAPVHVVAKTRDSKGMNHGRLLKWKDDEGREHQWAMPMELLATDPAIVRARLLSEGLPYLNPSTRLRERFAEYLQTVPVARWVRCVDRIGWHGQAYVLPGWSLSTGGAETVLYQPSYDTTHYWTVSGTAEEWRESIGRLCINNSRLVLTVSCAFGGPILSLIGAESGGVHLVGATSTGKTTALAVAASVCGGPGFVQTWRATANGLEAMAEAHNDATLFLDELAQLDPREASETAYLLANGQGKSRMTRSIAVRKQLFWNLLFVSTGELSLSEHAGSMGRKTKGGVDVRLLNIPGEAGRGMGIFEDLHGYKSPDAFAHVLRDAIRSYYGAVFPEFVGKLLRSQKNVEKLIRTVQSEFPKQYTMTDAAGEVRRAAERFALIGAAGELATQFGLTGWPEGEAIEAAHRYFKDWLAERGTIGASDSHEGVRQVQAFLEAHGSSRFQSVRGSIDDDQTLIRERAGFKRVNPGTGESEFLILTEMFKREVCKGFSYKAIAHELERRGFLVRQASALTIKTRVPEYGNTRVFCIRAAILGGDEC